MFTELDALINARPLRFQSNRQSKYQTQLKGKWLGIASIKIPLQHLSLPLPHFIQHPLACKILCRCVRAKCDLQQCIYWIQWMCKTHITTSKNHVITSMETDLFGGKKAYIGSDVKNSGHCFQQQKSYPYSFSNLLHNCLNCCAVCTLIVSKRIMITMNENNINKRKWLQKNYEGSKTLFL